MSTKRRLNGRASLLIVMASTAVGVGAPASAQTAPPRNTTPDIPWFSTTFDGMTVIQSPNNPAKFGDITGGNWADIKNKPNDDDMVWQKNGQIYYEQGTIEQREASIVNDPQCNGGTCNPVLRFNIKSRHISNPSTSYRDQVSGAEGVQWKTRIQYEVKAPTTNIPNTNPQQKVENTIPGGFPKAYYQKFRILFGSGFTRVKASNALKEGSWIILSEFFNDSQQLNFDKKLARISMKLLKDPEDKKPYSAPLEVRDPTVPANRDPLRFALEMDTAATDPDTLLATNYQRRWSCVNRNYDVPMNRWLTMELYIKEGTLQGTQGRVYFAITDGTTKTVICNANALTISDAAGYQPDGQSVFSPLKLYTYEDVINAVNSGAYPTTNPLYAGYAKTLSVYFDDVDLWFNKLPSGINDGVITLPTNGSTVAYSN